MKLLKGAFAGGLVLFLWSFASWVILPWHDEGFKSFSNEPDVLAAVAAGSTESGVYLLPRPDHQKGHPGNPSDPFLHVVLQRNGYRPMGEAMFLGFLGNLLCAFLATLLLLQLGPRALVEKVLILLTAAVFAWACRAFGDVAYWGLPWRNALVDLADLLVGWTLAGSLLAWLTSPAAE